MKVTVKNIEGKIIRNNETYIVEDNTTLNNLVLSKTTLHPGKQTTGHSHAGLEEVYYFIEGFGEMLLKNETEEKRFTVKGGDIVLIPDGDFHQVFNTSDWSEDDLVFVCVFQKYER